MSEPNKCVDCGFELDYSDEDIPQCFRCDSQEWQRMLDKATAELKQLRGIIAFYDIEIMPDGSFTSPRITQNEVEVKALRELTAELKELREFVGAMKAGSAVCTDSGTMLCGIDGKWYTSNHGRCDSAIDAWRKMNAGEGKAELIEGSEVVDE